jgi:tRNA (guanosine-2'-O-)-methyltransferase
MERVIACLEPLVTPERRARMQSVLARRSDHVAFVFERMVDPHNLSAVLRSLDALSFQDAHLIDPQERIELARGITIGAERWLTLHDHGGYRVLASRVAGRGATSLTELDFRERTALVFGNEHLGVGDEVAELADGAFHIEMLGFAESFNLSVAAALCAFHARREMERLMAADPEPGRFLLPQPRRREIYAAWLRRSIKRSEQILAETGEG